MNTEKLPSFVNLDVYAANAANTAMNTEITYEYRDAANYKKHRSYVFSGVIQPEQVRAIADNCFKDMGEHDFLPAQVGLARLCPMQDDEAYDDDLDHSIHVIIELGLTAEPANTKITLEELVARFTGVTAQGWDLVEYGN